MEFNGALAERKEYFAAGAADELFVAEVGPDDAPAVVVLHGGPGAQHDYLFRHLAPLADDFHLYFYDQRGGGRSRVERPARVGWRDHVADLEALRAGWGLERAALLGYSWGGLLALLYATEHPRSPGRLVLVSPAAGWGDYHRRFKEEFERRSNAPAVQRMRAELAASGLRGRDGAAYRQRSFELSVAGYFRDPRDAAGATRFLVQTQAQQATWASLHGYGPQLKSNVETLDVPTLILQGRYDPIPLEWAEELAGTMAAARLVVLENSGHVPYVEEAERTLSEIRGFLKEHSG